MPERPNILFVITDHTSARAIADPLPGIHGRPLSLRLGSPPPG